MRFFFHGKSTERKPSPKGAHIERLSLRLLLVVYVVPTAGFEYLRWGPFLEAGFSFSFDSSTYAAVQASKEGLVM